MAYYFIATALAAVATLASALPTENGTVAALSKENVNTTDFPTVIYGDCPNKDWMKTTAYHVYPYEHNVDWYWNCGHQTTLTQCQSSLVFDAKYHYCTRDFDSSRHFICPHFVPFYRRYKNFPDPNFSHQYHRCWFGQSKSERLACSYDKVFNQYAQRCVAER